MRIRYVLCLALFFSSLAQGVAEYYPIARSVRALGMGGAFYSLSDDEYALFYNPAGLSLYGSGAQLLPINLMGEVSSGGASALTTIQNATKGTSDVSVVVERLMGIQGKPLSVGAGVFPCYVRHGFAVGILLGSTKANVALLGKEIDSTLDLTAISDSGLLIGTARSFLGNTLHVGLNSKFLVRAGGHKQFLVSDFAARDAFRITASELGGVGGGVDFDLGALYTLRAPWIGARQGFSLSLNNLAASRFTLLSLEGGQPPGLVRTLSVGTFFVVRGNATFSSLTFRLEFDEVGLGGESDPDRGARVGSVGKHLNVGLEIPVKDWIFLRGGLHQGSYTAGLGVALPMLRLDFATYAEELFMGVDRLPSRRYMLRLALGYVGAPRVGAIR